MLTGVVGALLVSLLESHYKEEIAWAALTPLYGMDWDRLALKKLLDLFPNRNVWYAFFTDFFFFPLGPANVPEGLLMGGRALDS